jgi:hypothetical protein
MHILAAAEIAYYRHRGYYTRHLNALLPYADLLAIPICPDGGNYRIVLGPARTRDGRQVPSGKFAIEDSGIGGHGSFVLGLDALPTPSPSPKNKEKEPSL